MKEKNQYKANFTINLFPKGGKKLSGLVKIEGMHNNNKYDFVYGSVTAEVGKIRKSESLLGKFLQKLPTISTEPTNVELSSNLEDYSIIIPKHKIDELSEIIHKDKARQFDPESIAYKVISKDQLGNETREYHIKLSDVSPGVKWMNGISDITFVAAEESIPGSEFVKIQGIDKVRNTTIKFPIESRILGIQSGTVYQTKFSVEGSYESADSRQKRVVFFPVAQGTKSKTD